MAEALPSLESILATLWTGTISGWFVNEHGEDNRFTFHATLHAATKDKALALLKAIALKHKGPQVLNPDTFIVSPFKINTLEEI